MAEPSDFQKGLVKEATYLRGRIITSYSQVEFLLADISVKLDLRFPYLIKDRIKAAKRIAERPGYEAYRDDLNEICDELLIYDELRTFMAHGFISLTTDKADNHLIEFLRYKREGEGQFTLLRATTTVQRLQQAAEDVTVYVQRAVTLFEKIYLEQNLEPR
jgi:hypothetical protein